MWFEIVQLAKKNMFPENRILTDHACFVGSRGLLLGEQDDIATYLILDTLLGFRSHKMNFTDLPARKPDLKHLKSIVSIYRKYGKLLVRIPLYRKEKGVFRILTLEILNYSSGVQKISGFSPCF